MADFTPCPQTGNDEDSLNHFRHRVSETLANIEKDRDLLCLNIVALNADLWDWYCALMGEENREKIKGINAISVQYAIADVMAMFDTCTSPEDPRIERILTTLKTYFSRDVTAKKYSYFL